MKPFGRILVAVDFSDESMGAWSRALELAKPNAAMLLVAHVYHAPNMIPAEAVAPGIYEEWDRNLRVAAGKRLDVLVDQAREAGLKARAILEAGHPDEIIVRAAMDEGADLIVMGTRGRQGVARVFLGSVAARVIATAPCPVLTVRTPEERGFLKLASNN